MDEDVKTIQDYFTADVNDRIRDISEQEMLKKLRNLEQSDYWIAILKYNQIRISIRNPKLFMSIIPSPTSYHSIYTIILTPRCTIIR